VNNNQIKRMIDFNNVANLSIDQFAYNKKTKTLSAEASDIDLKRWDTMLVIKGKTKTVCFVLDYFDYVGDMDERELAGVWYKPVLQPNDIKVLIIND
jgi:hypothetical protein